MRPSHNLENKIPSDTYLKFQLVSMKVQVPIFAEPPLEYNQDHMPLGNQNWLWPFLINLGVTWILCSLKLVLEEKAVKDTWVIKIRVPWKDISKQPCFRMAHLP